MATATIAATPTETFEAKLPVDWPLLPVPVLPVIELPVEMVTPVSFRYAITLGVAMVYGQLVTRPVANTAATVAVGDTAESNWSGKGEVEMAWFNQAA